ncbi:helix-turn-helix domain-containing protein [Rivihabitans pingtungensis]|uniref:HTH cro/C1-type domain-containing protein n=1 Tax=Rivihabitans pingtungensis TaxID=1054498 RepID=A0A318LBP7_9NEIS|nr:helix-turn-helix transcriptional regulator [Rivihabitans pingtungensis]PXX79127.1 hypothetical protein DFR34_10817 [Rivihabitans pingtungensis]
MNSNEIRALRNSKKMNQAQFWGALNVTQSCGSRYESGRKIPTLVQLMIDLVHVRGVDLNALPSAEDVQLLHVIRTQHTDLYHNLKMIVAASTNG